MENTCELTSDFGITGQLISISEETKSGREYRDGEFLEFTYPSFTFVTRFSLPEDFDTTNIDGIKQFIQTIDKMETANFQLINSNVCLV